MTETQFNTATEIKKKISDLIEVLREINIERVEEEVNSAINGSYITIGVNSDKVTIPYITSDDIVMLKQMIGGKIKTLEHEFNNL